MSVQLSDIADFVAVAHRISQNQVILPGFQKNVPEWLATSDIFVLSSLSEGTSVSLIESMAAGLPAVVTNVGGNPYVVQDGITGIVVPSRDVDALAGGMLSLAKNSDLYDQYSQNARKRFKKYFGIDRMHDSYLKLYTTLLAELSNNTSNV